MIERVEAVAADSHAGLPRTSSVNDCGPGTAAAESPPRRTAPEHVRVPLDDVDRELRIRAHEFAPGRWALDLREFRRSPSSVDPADFHPAVAGVTVPLHYALELETAVRTAARLARHHTMTPTTSTTSTP